MFKNNLEIKADLKSIKELPDQQTLGVSQKQTCYVLSRRGGYKWSTIEKIHAVSYYTSNNRFIDIIPFMQEYKTLN